MAIWSCEKKGHNVKPEKNNGQRKNLKKEEKGHKKPEQNCP